MKKQRKRQGTGHNTGRKYQGKEGTGIRPVLNKMTKAEFVRKMAEKADSRTKEALKMYNSFVDVLTEALVAGEDVHLPGLGTFLVRERAERTGRNPKTGEEITVPASRQISFKASRTFKDSVKG